MRLPGSILQGILARAALTFLRIYLGVALMVAAWLQLERDYAGELAGLLRGESQAGSPLWYQPFAEQVVLPRVALVAALIVWGELLVGCCLVLGLGTRLAAALAFLITLSLTLVEGSFWTLSSSYPSWMMLSLALLVGAAGRTWGLDAFLAARWPRSPLW